MVTRELIGVDFSGSEPMWSVGCTRSNVWIAQGEAQSIGLNVRSLVRVQELVGKTRHPFDGLCEHLCKSNAVAGIDAPFALPEKVFAGHVRTLWQRIANLDAGSRPFATGRSMVETLIPPLAPFGKKIFRDTEQAWRDKGVNVRSTVWSGPRGGAAFSVAMMTMLARHQGNVWPFLDTQRGSTLVEAFPAAQLRMWGLPHQAYSDSKGKDRTVTRRAILAGLESRGLRLGRSDEDKCVASPDALDAVICLFAARAVAKGALVSQPGLKSAREGHIAVHI
jgi:predicted nuclease with RNAse H fold